MSRKLTSEHADQHVFAPPVALEEILFQHGPPALLVDLVLEEDEEVGVVPIMGKFVMSNLWFFWFLVLGSSCLLFLASS